MTKNEPVLYYLKKKPKRGFVGEEIQIVPLELRCLLKEFVDLKKTIKMSFSIYPSTPDESIQETDKDKNNKKIVNLANPTDNEDAANKKYDDENRNNRFILFFVKICKAKFLIETFI